jgi:TolB-like protein
VSSFFAELKRRNVFKVGTVYAIISWLIIQVSAITFPALHLPAWAITLVTVLIIIGFPLILLFTWAFEKTAEGGFKPTRQVVLDESIMHITGRKFDLIIIVSLLVAVIFLVLENYVWEEEIPPPIVTTATEINSEIIVEALVTTDSKSIAVLPFVNMSADPDQEYFSDGISEEILNGLAHVKDLRVAARTSSFYFKGKDMQLIEIGESLKVNHVLEGSVRKAGDRLRITAQLIKVDDGFHLWSETYDRDLTDIFAVQDEIAKAVVDALKIELGIAEGSTLVDIGTSNREAYDWYLRGKDALVAGTAEAFERSIEYFNQAIGVDPDYVDAYAFLAYAHILQHPFTPYKKLAPAIKQAYSKALALAPNHSAALCAQGYDKILSEWDWIGAGKVFRTAVKNGKINNVCLGTYIYVYLNPLGQYDESITILRSAEQADPLNLEIKYQLGNHLGFYAGEWAAGISRLRAVLNIEPNRVFAHVVLTQTHLNAGQLDEAVISLASLVNLKIPDAYPYIVQLRGELAVLQGNNAKAQSVYEEALNIAENGANKSPDLWFGLGLTAVSLGYFDKAIADFNRSFDEDAFSMLYIRAFVTSWPPYSQGHGPALMAHPEFQAFLKRMNLDDASMAALKTTEATP